ncbi:hypothetical protein DWUX_1908 [Desulfovibrio diazotrophicus]|nr:hypothetical protein DWUX_1908 [Desulfovibrio diazotrophicus]
MRQCKTLYYSRCTRKTQGVVAALARRGRLWHIAVLTETPE